MSLIDADVLISKYGNWYVEEGTEEGFIGTIEQLVEMLQDAQPGHGGEATDMVDIISRQRAINIVKWNLSERATIEALEDLPAAQHQIVHCKDCMHNNDCEIQFCAHAGDNFFCSFGETEESIRRDVYE